MSGLNGLNEAQVYIIKNFFVFEHKCAKRNKQEISTNSLFLIEIQRPDVFSFIGRGTFARTCTKLSCCCSYMFEDDHTRVNFSHAPHKNNASNELSQVKFPESEISTLSFSNIVLSNILS